KLLQNAVGIRCSQAWSAVARHRFGGNVPQSQIGSLASATPSKAVSSHRTPCRKQVDSSVRNWLYSGVLLTHNHLRSRWQGFCPVVTQQARPGSFPND